MSSPVTFTWDNLIPGFCWTNAQDFVATLKSILSGTVNVNGIVIQPGLPLVGDQDKLWIRTDSSGRPVSPYLFQGQWIWPHPMPPGGKMNQVWDDTEANLWAYDGGDGTDPSISAPTATTGAMWKRNPNFGTDDGATPFRFPVGAGKNLTVYDGNPALVLAPGSVGGEERHSLSTDELPPHIHPVGDATNFNYDALGPVTRTSAPGTVPSGPNSTANKSHQNLPLFRAVIFAQRTARIYNVAS